MAKNWALVIGINQYDILQPLNYAKRDAQLMQEFLGQQVSFEKILFFCDDSPPVNGKSTRPNRSNLLRVLRQLFEQSFMQAGDNFWFFFSGHGMRYNDRDYLMPSDGDPGNIEETAISINHVTERLRRCGADNIVLILDACRNQSMRGGEGIGRQTEEMARTTGVISIFSCSPNEYSYEIDALQQGAFTRALLEGLGIQGQCATVERLNQYLSLRVPELVGQYKNAHQTPYMIVEPVNKSHLILVPRYATLADIATLKNDAYQAEVNKQLELAEQLWIRVNAAASGQDMEAINALQRIAQIRDPQPPLSSEKVESEGKSKSPTPPLPQTDDLSSDSNEQQAQRSRSQTAQTHEQNIVRYQQAFSKEIKRKFPISQVTRSQLQKLQRSLQLTDDEIAQIEQPLVTQKQAEQERLRQKQQAEYQQKLRQYEQELIKIIEAGNSVNSIKNWLLQRSLGLKETDIAIASIKARVAARYPIPVQPPQTNLLQIINRRPFLKWVGLGGAGLVSTVVGYEIFNDPSSQTPSPEDKPTYTPSPEGSQKISLAKPKYTPPPEGTPKVLGLTLWTVEFETVKVDEKGNQVNRFSKQAKFFKEDLGNSVTLEMISIPAGSFKMGSPPGEKSRSASEQPQHTVNVPTFFLGKFEVTQEQYQQVMNKNPSTFKGTKRPVESVSWNDAVEFCKKLSQKTGRKYRLPSEAEWEYACRAGTTTPFYFGETITTKLANYNGDYTYASEPKGIYRKETTDVGSFPPNAFGLYDMHGNIWEWCADTWHENYQGAPTNGNAWTNENDNQFRVMRCGEWDYYPGNCRSACRLRDLAGSFNIGFRVVCGLSPRTFSP